MENRHVNHTVAAYSIALRSILPGIMCARSGFDDVRIRGGLKLKFCHSISLFYLQLLHSLQHFLGSSPFLRLMFLPWFGVQGPRLSFA